LAAADSGVFRQQSEDRLTKKINFKAHASFFGACAFFVPKRMPIFGFQQEPVR
jgi:hypothetical protein